ncbi:hypothetical protein TWF718_002055 [Orbilia javanica]|uniref:Uncharacterized protein n=1 Tax=Orbilia javanica TaxID=47235 RepID=A0AAN8RNT2_9PEZI
MAWLANNPGYEGEPKKMAWFWDTVQQMAANGFLQRSSGPPLLDQASDQQAATGPGLAAPLISRIHDLNKKRDPTSL